LDIKWFLLEVGKLQEQPSMDGWQQVVLKDIQEGWFDIAQASPDELRSFLEQLDLHPLQIARCLDSINNPGVVSNGDSLLMEYPTAFNEAQEEPGYLSIIIHKSILTTIRHGPIPALDELIGELTIKGSTILRHLPQIVYLILDEIADLNIDAQIEIRDHILRMARDMAANPALVNATDLSSLRLKVDKLVSLMENQLYCVTALNASDNKALQETHRRTYIQDLVSEAEIAQRGVYRLENRLNNLFSDYQMAGSDRVEKRLRFLTIVSMITLPLGLIAGLLGMNVGGPPEPPSVTDSWL